MEQTSGDSAAMRQANWLVAAYADGGGSVTEEDLRERVAAPLREAQGWGTADAFRDGIAAEGVVLDGVRPDDEGAVIAVRTAGGIPLERHLRVDPDGRVTSITTRLAGGASMTMVSAAAWRAAHAAYDDPVILDDPYAAQLIGDASPYQVDAVRDGTHGTGGPHYRWNMVTRARFAEDTLAEQRAASGTAQYVLLGAGLDTFALRNPFDDVTVYEVDTPWSQAWKLERLAALGISTPDNVRFVACDFEEQDFLERLTAVGFDAGSPAVAAWLGVSYYLTQDAIRSTLERVAPWPDGSAIVFDYVLAEHRWDEIEGFDAAGMRAALAGVAAAGEPFISMFDDAELIDLCRSCGYEHVELLGDAEMRGRYVPGRPSGPGPDPVLKLCRAR